MQYKLLYLMILCDNSIYFILWYSEGISKFYILWCPEAIAPLKSDDALKQ